MNNSSDNLNDIISKSTIPMFNNYSLLDESCINLLKNRSIGLAAEHGHVELIKYLVENNLGDPYKDNNWAIRIAIECGYVNIVKYLISKGCDPTDYKNSAIKWCFLRGHIKMFRYLIEMGFSKSDMYTYERQVLYHKYAVLIYIIAKMTIFLSKRVSNKWLQMEIIKKILTKESEWTIFTTILKR